MALILLISLAVGAGVYQTVSPKQESKAQVLFVPSVKQPGVTGPTNPFLGLGSSVAVVASVVAVGVTADPTAKALYDQGNRATYTVASNLAENAGPVLIVTTDDQSGQMAQNTLKAVIKAIQQNLASIQAARNVPATLLITTQVITQSAHPEPVHKAQVQKAALAALAVLLVLIALLLLIERRRMRRRGATPVTTDRVGSGPVSSVPAAAVHANGSRPVPAPASSPRPVATTMIMPTSVPAMPSVRRSRRSYGLAPHGRRPGGSD